MNNMALNKKLSWAIVYTVLISILVCALVFSDAGKSLFLNGSAGAGYGVVSGTGQPKADVTVTVNRHLPSGSIETVGSMTKLGVNCSFAKFTGLAASYNMTEYNYNISSISIGNQGTLNSDSTVLPGEWNRTSVTAHDASYNSCNFTAVFHPDAGPYTADCIGLNIGPVTTGLAYTLICYDTFTEVTGIDSTFTITVEFRLYSSSA